MFNHFVRDEKVQAQDIGRTKFFNLNRYKIPRLCSRQRDGRNRL